MKPTVYESIRLPLKLELKFLLLFSDTSQVLGRHLGRRTFRKLDFSNRGFVTIGQMFRLTSSDNMLSDNLNSDEIRVRKGSKFDRKITETELSEAGMSFVEGELPNQSLNSEFNRFRCRFEQNSVFGFDSLLCSKNEISSSKSFWMMTIFALISALINISPKLVLVFGLFCQTLFELLFGPAIERQFDLWSKFWTGACKLYEQKVFECKQTLSKLKRFCVFQTSPTRETRSQANSNIPGCLSSSADSSNGRRKGDFVLQTGHVIEIVTKLFLVVQVSVGRSHLQ